MWVESKLFLSINDVKPGMITAEAVFNSFGNVLLWDNTVLNDQMINHLKNMGILTVAVYKQQHETFNTAQLAEENVRRFAAEYENDARHTKKIFEEISSGKRLNKEEADNIADSVIKKAGNNRYIIDSVMQVRNVDEYTYYHSINVSLLCMMIGKWMKLSEKDINNLTLAGLLHDIGKTKIAPEILNKPGKLTDSEFEEIKRHSEYGYYIVKETAGIPAEVATAILTHHEKEDGSGYPMGLTGDQLNLYSKIITVADIFDAMTAKRIYKNNDTPFKVFELMQHGSFGVLDPLVLKTFLENVTGYYVGSKVRLNTEEIGEVVFMNKLDFSRPVVLVNNRYVDTMVSKTEKIVEFL